MNIKNNPHAKTCGLFFNKSAIDKFPGNIIKNIRQSTINKNIQKITIIVTENLFFVLYLILT